jgi:predicted metal-dependent phosphoesterase TrpH
MLADLHVHTKYSFDCLSEPVKILRMAEKRGLGAIAITDHNSFKGSLVLSKMNKTKMIIIKGIEVYTNIGDLSGLFIQEKIKSKNHLEVIDEIKEQGGLVYFPHPFRAHKKVFSENVDVFEIFSSRNKPEQNARAESFAKRMGKAVAAGSDAHTYLEVGLAGIKIENVESEEDVRKLIMRRKVEIFGKYCPIYLKRVNKAIGILKSFNLI